MTPSPVVSSENERKTPPPYASTQYRTRVSAFSVQLERRPSATCVKRDSDVPGSLGCSLPRRRRATTSASTRAPGSYSKYNGPPKSARPRGVDGRLRMACDQLVSSSCTTFSTHAAGSASARTEAIQIEDLPLPVEEIEPGLHVGASRDGGIHSGNGTRAEGSRTIGSPRWSSRSSRPSSRRG